MTIPNILYERKLLILTKLIAIFLFSACSFYPKTTIPIETTSYVVGAGSAKTLLVMLPGIRDSDKSFARNDFITILNQNNIDVEVITVNANIAYYKNRGLIDRLEQDVIQVAKQEGYKNIWLLGISLGGLGAMLYTNEQPEDIQGIILLAPYLGDRDIIEEIKSYASLEEWAKFAKQFTRENSTEKSNKLVKYLWLPLIERKCYTHKPIYLLYGDEDKHKFAHDVMASCLSADSVITIEGKHNWKTWKMLWDSLLAKYPNIFTESISD